MWFQFESGWGYQINIKMQYIHFKIISNQVVFCEVITKEKYDSINDKSLLIIRGVKYTTQISPFCECFYVDLIEGYPERIDLFFSNFTQYFKEVISILKSQERENKIKKVL